MIQNGILRRLFAGFCVLPFFAFLLVLARHSYRVKELLICWLFFCLFFAVLALMFLGAVLACHAGLYFVKQERAANTITPELVAGLAEPPREAISGPRILVAGTHASLDALGAHPGLLIEVRPTTEAGV